MAKVKTQKVGNEKSASGIKQESLQQILFSQGFGTRRDCDALITRGRVQIAGQVCSEPEQLFNPHHLSIDVGGVIWPVRPFALLMLHKPTGYECSMKPKHYPGVLTLLPDPIRARSKGGVQPVGRLDADTTGLLLLTDDGALIHRLTSPKHHVDKVYDLTLFEPVDAGQIAQLRAGVVLADDPIPVMAADCKQTGTHSIALTLTEGKYHQVKRMMVAVGNHVTALHRSSFGQLHLPADLSPGQWRWVTVEDIDGLPGLKSPGPLAGESVQT